MQARWLMAATFALALAICEPAPGQQLPLEPVHESGQGVTGALEGWVPNQDGTYSILLGYFNRNIQEPLDIPIGPNNRIEPGGPDQGQPTHFLPGRQWGVFSVIVPKDFGDKHLTWTLVANGKTSVIPLYIKTLWRLEPFRDATGKTPPYIGFSDAGPFVNGPFGQSQSLTATVATPLPLTVWVADDAKDPLLRNQPKRPAVTVQWIMLRGPAAVKFANERPPAEPVELKAPPPGTPFNAMVTTTAVFSEPGDYILNLQADDATGGGPGARQCCWSNARVKVSVKP
jgi:hypothetical protein